MLNLAWTYLVKDCDTLKAQCVHNGQSLTCNTVIFVYTLAKMLDHTGSNIFLAACTAKNFVIRGDNTSDAFDKVAALKIPLYVRINTPFTSRPDVFPPS